MVSIADVVFYVMLGVAIFFIGIRIYDMIKASMNKKKEEPTKQKEQPVTKGGDYL